MMLRIIGTLAGSARGRWDKPARKKFKAYPISCFHVDLAEVRTEQGGACQGSGQAAWSKRTEGYAADLVKKIAEFTPSRYNFAMNAANQPMNFDYVDREQESLNQPPV